MCPLFGVFLNRGSTVRTYISVLELMYWIVQQWLLGKGGL